MDVCKTIQKYDLISLFKKKLNTNTNNNDNNYCTIQAVCKVKWYISKPI